MLCFCRYGIPAVLLLSVVITVVLLFYPRQSPGDAMMDTGQEVGGEREREGWERETPCRVATLKERERREGEKGRQRRE